ncbi:hypothetical protein NDU88_006170 [Pleurodeles waltl]|uniref:Uncharacterized protein n=1 Tax=Pleurodeles waltl TaxID=8319 RepID=A0AAV7WZZ7_PLEWA|nr:hypothetical protein NDU88_006170 [Pleurodeles waltl]
MEVPWHPGSHTLNSTGGGSSCAGEPGRLWACSAVYETASPTLATSCVLCRQSPTVREGAAEESDEWIQARWAISEPSQKGDAAGLRSEIPTESKAGVAIRQGPTIRRSGASREKRQQTHLLRWAAGGLTDEGDAAGAPGRPAGA